MVNFMLGRRAVGYPKYEDVVAAKEYANSHRPWPNEESIQIIGEDVLVVVFQKSGNGVRVTMTR